VTKTAMGVRQTQQPNPDIPLDLPRLRYFTAVAQQVPDAWKGFYHPAVRGSNLEYLFQIAFAGYALTAMQRQVPAWCGPDAPFARGVVALTQRMRDERVWRYWSARMADPDPVTHANIMYSGHLSCLLSLAELLSGDASFDDPFDLVYEGQHAATHDHTSVAAAIHRQMVAEPNHGVACEPGRIYICCNNHAAISNLLYDRCHPGRDLSAINAEWSAWVRRRMVLAPWHALLPGPPGGILSGVHFAPNDLSLPAATNFTDAWGLALMTPYDAALPRLLAPRLWRRLHRDRTGAFLPSLRLLTQWEASDTALNTGFAYVLARELGETAVATRLRSWAEAHLGPRTEQDHGWYTGEHSALYTTALFALGDAIAPGGIAQLFTDPPVYDDTAPRVAVSSFPAVALTRAVWNDHTQTMSLSIAPIAAMQDATASARLVVTNLPRQPQVPLDWASVAKWDADADQLTIALAPGPAVDLVIACA